MATSGSTNFTMTALDICKKAMLRATVLEGGEEPDAADLATVMQSLNLMIKAWETEGIYLWSNTEDTFPTVIGTAAYLFGPAGTKTYRPLRITSVRYATSVDTDLPLIPLGRQEYFDLPSKGTAGQPTQFFYDPQRAAGTLYLWPVPDAVSALKYTYVRQFEDFDTNSDEADIPTEWLNALIWNLAVDICPEFGITGQSLKTAAGFADKYKSDAVNWDQDMEGITITPDPNWTGF